MGGNSQQGANIPQNGSNLRISVEGELFGILLEGSLWMHTRIWCPRTGRTWFISQPWTSWPAAKHSASLQEEKLRNQKGKLLESSKSQNYSSILFLYLSTPWDGTFINFLGFLLKFNNHYIQPSASRWVIVLHIEIYIHMYSGGITCMSGLCLSPFSTSQPYGCHFLLKPAPGLHIPKSVVSHGCCPVTSWLMPT